MRKRTSIDAIRPAVLASLGLLGGCGGSTATIAADGAAPGPDADALTGGDVTAASPPTGAGDATSTDSMKWLAP